MCIKEECIQYNKTHIYACRRVIHRVTPSIAGIRRVTSSIAGIHLVTPSIAWIHRVTPSIAGIHLVTPSIAGNMCIITIIQIVPHGIPNSLTSTNPHKKEVFIEIIVWQEHFLLKIFLKQQIVS